MSNVKFKSCSKCKTEKPWEQFGIDRRATTGLQSQCLQCQYTATCAHKAANPEIHKQWASKHYNKNKTALLAGQAIYREKNADAIKAQKRASHMRDREKPEYQARLRARPLPTKSEKAEYDRCYRSKNVEKLKAMKIVWRANNLDLIRAVKHGYKARRRSQEAAGDTSKAVRDWLAGVHKKCAWCEVDCLNSFHIDHFVPLARGGPHRVSNLVIACPTCNMRKNATEPRVFCERMGFDFSQIESRRSLPEMLS